MKKKYLYHAVSILWTQKSILGVFSLNLSYDLSLSILTDDNKVRDKLHNDIEKFIVNKGE